jgi:hypothetical protein
MYMMLQVSMFQLMFFVSPYQKAHIQFALDLACSFSSVRTGAGTALGVPAECCL